MGVLGGGGDGARPLYHPRPTTLSYLPPTTLSYFAACSRCSSRLRVLMRKGAYSGQNE